ncbi:hypothetical protein [Salinibacterium sp.]|uniref:hypothetical protein n=1 Tax=Salinibacterium sp. TaxID=1915057 RepID=UPI00286C0B8E|nr:hypothetical protein [Salinibacterium sp.]
MPLGPRMQYGTSIEKRAKAARRQSELDSAGILTNWYAEEKTKIKNDVNLDEPAQKLALHALFMEFGKRSSRAISKAKRDNSLPKFLEREANEEIARGNAAKRL